MGIGGLTFLNPWVLAALGLLPLLVLMLRLLPPAPKRVLFPPVRLLKGLDGTETAQHRPPLWLMILRLTLIALLIVAAAGPVLNPRGGLVAPGPLVLVIDDDWAAAPGWEKRRRAMLDWIARAGRDDRAVVLALTAPNARQRASLDMLTVADARKQARALQPKAWQTDRETAQKSLQALSLDAPATVVWISNGLNEATDAATDQWIHTLRRLGPLTVIRDPARALPLVLRPAVGEGPELAVRVDRAASGGERSGHVLALADDGSQLARAPFAFTDGETETRVPVPLPAEWRKRVLTLRIEGEKSAAATVLLDDRWRRRAVGILAPATTTSPLLGPRHYLSRALAISVQVRSGESIRALMERPLGLMILADPPPVSTADESKLRQWMHDGGVVVRFAGPRLAEHPDALVPVPLRQGGRALGGALSWNKPVRLGSFANTGPLHGITVPDDVTVRRQVLARPSPDLADFTWATLADGTPLVTARQQGRGWLVLVHTTADPSWSNLALSGVFVDMLERLLPLASGGGAIDGNAVLAPFALLDAFGDRQGTGAGTGGIDTSTLETLPPGPRTPPGLYGDETHRRAFNLGPYARPVALSPLPSGVSTDGFDSRPETSLQPYVLMAALLLMLADAIASLVLRGGWPGTRNRTRAAIMILAAFWSIPVGAEALPPASLQTRLAHVITGNASLDALVADGLTGISVVINRRTSAELGTPVAVDIRRDSLAFYPLLYWPLTPQVADLDEAVAARLGRYLEKGGMVLFDGGMLGAGGLDAGMLRDVARTLKLPTLTPIPSDHVLGRSFYLLHRFPGRWRGDGLWVEPADARVNDGVSAVIAGAGGWAAAWAMDETQRFTTPVVPGGERQREQALRFGVNLVMYALTGNYKADQVHVPAILQRLSQ